MMKTISLWQPWASLLACGAKLYESEAKEYCLSQARAGERSMSQANDYQQRRRQQRRLSLTPQPETNWQALRRQAGEDKITVTLVIVCLLLLGAVLAAQAGLHWNF